MGGEPEWVWRGGARLTPWMAYELDRLDADLRRLFGVGLVYNSGIRLPQEQINIFLQRYVTAGNVGGRRVYDTRWWRGQLWYRISNEGTVAVPSTSNHEIQGTTAAVDIADTGREAGISNRNSVRGRWLRAHAAEYSLVASGDGFDEGWHFDVLHIFNTPPVRPAPEVPKESDMTMIFKSTSDGPAGLIQKEGYWVQGTEGPLRQIDSTELGMYLYWNSTGKVYFPLTERSGAELERIIAQVGVREFAGQGRFEDGLSGRIRYTRDRVEYPKVELGPETLKQLATELRK